MASRPNLLDALRERPLLCDGAMGTQLMSAGLSPGASGESWNLDNRDRVRSIHEAYVEAGCELITTNSFGGSRPALSKHGLQARVRDINVAAAYVARLAAGERAWVLGDVGPFGGFLEPMGDMSAAALHEIFIEQVTALADGGADAILVETMVDPAELSIAVRAARQVKDWPVLAAFAFGRQPDGSFRTMMGTAVREAIEAARDAGAHAVGANCGTFSRLGDYVELAREIVESAGSMPVIIQPNAGAPRLVDDRVIHPATPADMAGIVEPLLQAGVRVIGGCCGTTPAHLSAMARVLRQPRERQR